MKGARETGERERRKLCFSFRFISRHLPAYLLFPLLFLLPTNPLSLWLICMQIRHATQMRRASRGVEGRVKVSRRWGRTGRREKRGGDAGSLTPPGSKLVPGFSIARRAA